ncbi:MAG: hypothetical protein NTY32_00505, partial [Bacteroidia bacterium]|nr:hypothetical protein [Bacteroidia bacterium]
TTSGTSVTATFEMLDGKNVAAAYLWKNTSGFAEYPMTKVTSKKYTYTLAGQTTGTKLALACKFVVENGSCVTQYLTYTVGNTCATTSLEGVVDNVASFYPNPAKDVLYFKSDNPIQ